MLLTLYMTYRELHATEATPRVTVIFLRGGILKTLEHSVSAILDPIRRWFLL
jgi:hypothetical protein